MYLYLLENGYSVSVGKIGNLECDFIARKEMTYYYIQIAMTIFNDIKCEDREYAPFFKIRDNYPKYLFTLDQFKQQRDGIIHLNLIDFIQSRKTL